jgi:hypothetical protein
MGVRLYPLTQDIATLERLAGVTAGTKKRLDEIQSRHAAERTAAGKDWDSQDDGYRQWKEIKADVDLHVLDSFLTFGWGKFDGLGVATGYSGSLADLDQVALLFRANGIDADPALAGGVCWN